MTDDDAERVERDGNAPEVQIPDGGLGSAMPTWLRQPPAWKREPVRIAEPDHALPAPDDSTIDPRTLLDVDDLPRWLQDLARPPAGDIVPGGVEREAVAGLGEGGPKAEPVTDERSTLPVGVDESPIAPTVRMDTWPDPIGAGVRADTGSAPTNEYGPIHTGESSPTPWWLSDRVLGLVLLGLVLAMIYVVLAVSGVV